MAHGGILYITDLLFYFIGIFLFFLCPFTHEESVTRSWMSVVANIDGVITKLTGGRAF